MKTDWEIIITLSSNVRHVARHSHSNNKIQKLELGSLKTEEKERQLKN